MLVPDLGDYQVLEHVRSDPHTPAHVVIGDCGLALESVETMNAGSLFDEFTAPQALP
jgi:hypothetical protein